MDWRPLFSKIWVSDGVGFIVRCGKVSVTCGGGREGGMKWVGGVYVGNPGCAVT